MSDKIEFNLITELTQAQILGLTAKGWSFTHGYEGILEFTKEGKQPFLARQI